MFCALNIEVRDGGLNERDLRNRMNFWSNMADTGDDPNQREKSPIGKVQDKYPNIGIYSDILNSDVLVQMFVEGCYRSEAIRQSLDTSSEFAEPKDLPPWRRVIGFDRLEDEDVNTALEQMNRQFKKREIIDSGKMLHIFALKMMMSENGINDVTIGDVEASCLKYIDDLRKSERLPPRSTVSHLEYDYDHAHAAMRIGLQKRQRSTLAGSASIWWNLVNWH